MKEPVLEENYMKIIGSLEQNDLKKLIEQQWIYWPYLYVLLIHDKGAKIVWEKMQRLVMSQTN